MLVICKFERMQESNVRDRKSVCVCACLRGCAWMRECVCVGVRGCIHGVWVLVSMSAWV